MAIEKPDWGTLHDPENFETAKDLWRELEEAIIDATNAHEKAIARLQKEKDDDIVHLAGVIDELNNTLTHRLTALEKLYERVTAYENAITKLQASVPTEIPDNPEANAIDLDGNPIKLDITGGRPDKPELKPCPFCGGEAEMTNPEYEWKEIACKDTEKCGAIICTNESPEDLITAWNTRPIEDRLKAENERLKKIRLDEGKTLEFVQELKDDLAEARKKRQQLAEARKKRQQLAIDRAKVIEENTALEETIERVRETVPKLYDSRDRDLILDAIKGGDDATGTDRVDGGSDMGRSEDDCLEGRPTCPICNAPDTFQHKLSFMVDSSVSADVYDRYVCGSCGTAYAIKRVK